MSLRRLALTDLKVKICKGVQTHTLQTVIEKEGVAKKWAETKQAKRMTAQAKRVKLNDFERFQVMVLKRQKSYMVNKDVAQTSHKGKKVVKKAKKAEQKK